MKRNYLFPYRFRFWGWVLLVPSLCLGLNVLYGWGPSFHWMDELSVIGLTMALLFIGFARCRQEDECTATLRLKALTLAILTEYAVLIAGTLIYYDFDYFTFVCYNLFTVLVVFALLHQGFVWFCQKGWINVNTTRMWLFPSKCKQAGWALAVPFAAACIYVLIADINLNHWLDEVSVIGLTVSLLLISFSREKQEDEYITALRSKAWVWAVYVSYIILLIGTVSFYGDAYLYFFFSNLFTLPVVFILRFRWMMYQLKKEENNHDE